MKYTPIGISPEQVQFLETRKFQIDEIARIFRVPQLMVGDLEKSSLSNIEQQSLELVKHTLEPWLVHWEQFIQRTLFSAEEKKQYFTKFNVEGLLWRLHKPHERLCHCKAEQLDERQQNPGTGENI